MGSWNETCAVSRLPICAGDEVVGVLLMSMGKTPRFSPSGAWVPIGLPVYGTYDDYGGIENVKWSDEEGQYWADQRGPLAKLVPLKQGENPYHDPPIDRDIVTQKGWEVLQEAAREERLLLERETYQQEVSGMDGAEKSGRVKGYGEVTLIQIHKKVWDLLVQTPHDHFSKDKLLNQAKAYRNEIAIAQKHTEDKDSSQYLLKQLRRERNGHVFGRFMQDEDGRESGEYCSKILVRSHERLVESKSPFIDDFENRASELLMVECAFHVLRRYWQPSGMTSQETEVKKHIHFQKEVMEFSKSLHMLWDLDEDEEEPVVVKPSKNKKPK